MFLLKRKIHNGAKIGIQVRGRRIEDFLIGHFVFYCSVNFEMPNPFLLAVVEAGYRIVLSRFSKRSGRPF
jgi:hypothetical protein